MDRLKSGLIAVLTALLITGCADLHYPARMSGPHAFQMVFDASPEAVEQAVRSVLEEEDFSVQVHEPARRLIARAGVTEETYLLVRLVPLKSDENGFPRTLLGIRHLGPVRSGIFGLNVQTPYLIPDYLRKDLPDRLLEKLAPGV